jgi:hypothetical protein
VRRPNRQQQHTNKEEEEKNDSYLSFAKQVYKKQELMGIPDKEVI